MNLTAKEIASKMGGRVDGDSARVPGPGHSRAVPVQLEMGDKPSLVRLGRSIDHAKPCCENLAIVHPRKGVHAAELRCANCNKHRGWMRKEAYTFLTEVARLWGAPEILTLREDHIGDHGMTPKSQRQNSGVLFKNNRKETDNHPDYTGTINVNGVEFYLNAWIKQGQKAKFMSLSVKPKETHQLPLKLAAEIAAIAEQTRVKS
jgi:hypothetical protein